MPETTAPKFVTLSGDHVYVSLSHVVDELEDAATDCDGHTPHSILMALSEELRREAAAQ